MVVSRGLGKGQVLPAIVAGGLGRDPQSAGLVILPAGIPSAEVFGRPTVLRVVSAPITVILDGYIPKDHYQEIDFQRLLEDLLRYEHEKDDEEAILLALACDMI